MKTIERTTKTGRIIELTIEITKHAFERMAERGATLGRVYDAFRFGDWSINDRHAFEFIYNGLKVIANKEAAGFEVSTIFYV